MSNFAARSPEIAALLKNVTFGKPAQVFERKMVLDLGGVRVRIMRPGPGHTRGDTVMFVEEDRVLFAGDLTMKGLFPTFASPQSRSDTWLASLDEMERLKPRIVVGGRKSADEAGKTLVDEFRATYPG